MIQYPTISNERLISMSFKGTEDVIRDKIYTKESHKNHHTNHNNTTELNKSVNNVENNKIDKSIKLSFNRNIKAKLKNDESLKNGPVFNEEINKDEQLINIELSSKCKTDYNNKKLKNSKSKKTIQCINKIHESQGINFITKYHHPGKWQFIIQEQMECWSCCLNEEKESEGCVKEKDVKVILK